MNNFVEKSIDAHLDVVKSLRNLHDQIGNIYDIAFALIEAIKNGSTIFWCGNGGSASQANHLSAELVGGMKKDKINPFKSICLNTDSAFITAWSNDDKFENIFKRQLQANASEGDILIGLSTSGNSKNVIEAATYANSSGIKVVSLTGNQGGHLRKISEFNVNIESNSTPRIQEVHILIGHIICDLVEEHYMS